MARLRNSRGQWISKFAEEGIRETAKEQGAKDVQSFFIQNENELRGFFTTTVKAKFSSENAAQYINDHFDRFKINDGEKLHNVSRNEAIHLVSQFNNWMNKEGANFALFHGTMKDRDKDQQYHTLEIFLPINKAKKGFRISREKAEKMESQGKIEYFKSDYKKRNKNRSRNRSVKKRKPSTTKRKLK